MKRFFRLIGFLSIFVLFSVGIKYSPNEFYDISNIYLTDSLLLISDTFNGITVYSTAASDTPTLITSIPLNGARGMAVKNDIIYAGLWDRIGVYRLTDDGGYDSLHSITLSTWFEGDDIMEVQRYEYHRPFFSCSGCSAPMTADEMSGGGSTGTGGSYAVFAVIDRFLYYVDQSELIALDITDPAKPKELSRLYIDWSIETLYPMEEYLYIGGQMGMYVVDRHNGAQPKMIGSLQHFRACDPVVVRDTFAFVTLRSGSGCGGSENTLLTVSVANPINPKLLNEKGVVTPYGLAVQDSLLFVANGENGYTLFRTEESIKPQIVKQWDDPPAKDFIWSGTSMYMMGFNQVHLVDVSDPMEPRITFTIR